MLGNAKTFRPLSDLAWDVLSRLADGVPRRRSLINPGINRRLESEGLTDIIEVRDHKKRLRMHVLITEAGRAKLRAAIR